MERCELRQGMVLWGVRRTFSDATRVEIPTLWDEVLPLLRAFVGSSQFETFGACLPSETEGAFDYMVCVQQQPGTDPEPGHTLEMLCVPAAMYSIFEHRGDVSTLPAFISNAWSEGVSKNDWTVEPMGIGLEQYPIDWTPTDGPTFVFIPVK